MNEQLSPMESVRSNLTRMAPEFSAALPSHIPAERFIRTAITAVQLQPELLSADRRSLLGACMKAAQDGLLPDGRDAALVIFRGKGGSQVQYMPMIGGILKKLRNSGELASISAHVVYERDEFAYELGTNEQITHRPHLSSTETRGRPIAVYAVAKTKDGGVYHEVMSVEEVEKVRAVSRAGSSANSPWAQWWDEMARKTVIRRICKRLPSSADTDQMMAHDNENYDFSQRSTSGRARIMAAIATDEVPEQEDQQPVDEPVSETTIEE